MNNSVLAKKFDIINLLKFTFPSILTMLFMSTYTIVDGIFVSKFVGEDALAAVNIIMPIFGIMMALGLMFATGGNAVVAKYLGEGENEKAKQTLTSLYLIAATLSVLFTGLTLYFADEILVILNVRGDLYSLARDYMQTISIFFIFVFFQIFAQTFMITAGRPTLGFLICALGGITNIVLDYFLISPNFADLGIAGAALATGIGNIVPGIICILYFLFKKNTSLRFTKPSINFKILGHIMFNGSSELVGSLATSITTLLFNVILLDLAGPSGVAAISVILYVQMIQNAIYLGYTIGVSPIIAYKFGADARDELKKIVSLSFKIITVSSIIVLIFTYLFRFEAISLFIENDSSTFELASRGLLLFMPAYAFMGYNLFVSSLFTALSNGKVSATIAVLRSLVFIVIALFVLPVFLDIDGVWLSVPLAELLSIFVCLYFFKKYKNKYSY